MREWQSLSQITHLCVVSGRMELLPSFLCARLSAAAANSLSSCDLSCCLRALLHFVRSDTMHSQDSVDVDSLRISYADIFISLTQTISTNTQITTICNIIRSACNLPDPTGLMPLRGREAVPSRAPPLDGGR